MSQPNDSVVIDAVLYDGYEYSDADEAVRLRNVGGEAVDLSDWLLTDGSSSAATFVSGTLLPAGNSLWLARQASAFRRQFGFQPEFEVTETDPEVPNLLGSWPGFSNSGDEVLLVDGAGAVADALVYAAGAPSQAGWVGASVQPYVVSGVFGEEGQILYRRRDQTSGLPVTDTNSAQDWAQSTNDIINGRKVLYPGWALDAFFFTSQITETAVLTVAIAPDNAYATVAAQLDSAQSSLRISSLTLENMALAGRLLEALNRGVSVTVLLEGSPVSGLTDQEKYICQQLEADGGQCWFLVSNDDLAIHDRYSYMHAKYIIVDDSRVIISSENLSPDSMPDDDKGDGTWGRRGVALISDAPGVVERARAIFAADFNPAAHVDLLRWTAGDPAHGAPAPGFVPITVTGGITYTVRYPAASAFEGTFAFEVVQSPENSLRNEDSLLGLLARVGEGDSILVQQLSERPYWGNSVSNAVADPNPRLEAYLAAARRGAKVRLLLDAFFDDGSSPVSNEATCRIVNELATSERLDLECSLGNPAGLGIHNKMVLIQVDGRGYVHVGSLNGGELAHKGNRELALQVQSDGAFALLADMFERDWPHRAFSPMVFALFLGPAHHVLISEVLYDPLGPDDAEFIEIVNPTPQLWDLGQYSLGDAVNITDFEDVRRFPNGVTLSPGATLVVATTATAFRAQFLIDPQFEVIDSDPGVPDLIDDPAWGDPAALLQLGNEGDEVILRDSLGNIVDVMAYGASSAFGLPCPLVLTSNHSLERYPYWRDSNECLADFRDWAFPNPGTLP